MTEREAIKDMVNAIISAHEIKEFQKHDELKEELHRALIAARDSAPSSFSRLFQDLNDKIDDKHDKLNGKFDALERKINPVVDIYDSAGKMSRFIVWLAKVMGSAGVIVLSLYAIKDWIRK